MTSAHLISSVFLGIDKLTEKSQVSEDGTMVSVPKTDPQSTDQSAAAGTSDTESNSGRDNEVRVCAFACVCFCVIKSCLFIRMFSTRKQRWRDVGACRVPPLHRFGAPLQTGLVPGVFIRWHVDEMCVHVQVCPRSSPGSVNSHCRPSCASCRCWFLRWRRSASTSGHKAHF